MQRFDGSFNCYFCDEEGHIKPQCPHLHELINAGSVHVDEESRICLGPPRQGAMPIWRLPGITWLQTVQKQVKMKEAPASVGFNMIRADLEEDSDVEVSEGRYVDAFGARADV
jgi:hypothetical protein